jgi:hypothetical protein
MSKIPKKGQTVAIAFYPNTMVYCKVIEVVKTEPGLKGQSADCIIVDDPIVEKKLRKKNTK